MYNPPSFVEERKDVLHSLIRQHPFGIIVTCGANGPEATHVPIVLHADEGNQGVLRFHLARANAQWKGLAGAEPLVIFQGPHHYITPSWYTAKEPPGQEVPTWNYITVHVRGRATLVEDQTKLIQHLHDLTNQSEDAFEQRWSLNEASEEYVASLSKGIVGIELTIATMEGKWKLSQNRLVNDRKGVVAGLSELDQPASGEMADLVAERIPE